MTTKVDVEGDTRLRATLALAANRVQDMSEPGRAASGFIAARGRADAPRLTGRLSSSHRATSTKTEAEVSSALAYANRTHWGYARYGQRPQPWLAEGMHKTEPTWIKAYEHRIDTVLDGVKGA